MTQRGPCTDSEYNVWAPAGSGERTRHRARFEGLAQAPQERTDAAKDARESRRTISTRDHLTALQSGPRWVLDIVGAGFARHPPGIRQYAGNHVGSESVVSWVRAAWTISL
jgi:hypothetical protein